MGADGKAKYFEGTYSEILKMRMTSINNSVTWLKNNIWNRTYKNKKRAGSNSFHKWRQLSRKMKRCGNNLKNNPTKEEEKYFRHSVEHWKRELELQDSRKAAEIVARLLKEKMIDRHLIHYILFTAGMVSSIPTHIWEEITNY